MKFNKVFQIITLICVMVFNNACKTEDKDLNPDHRTIIAICDVLNSTNETKVRLYSIGLNNGFVSVSKTESVAGDGSTFKLNGAGVKYNYTVSEWGLGTAKTSISKSYSGTLNDAAFVKNQKNKIDVVRNGEDWKLLVNGKNEDVEGLGGGEEAEPSITNVWQRYGSPKGYQTDLAIGNIPGEAKNRVYMCEHPGSPSAGLYKGYINGNTITWDAVHRLPDAVFNLIGTGPDRSLYFGVGLPTEAGKYKIGTWSGVCGALENSNKNISVGLNSLDFPFYKITKVTIENINCPLVKSPDCSSNSFITTPSTSSNPEYYRVRITYTGDGLNGSYTKTDESIIYKTELSADCNKYKVYDNGTGRLALLRL